MVTAAVMIVTPIWRSSLTDIEAGFLKVTDRANRTVPRAFVAPLGMNTDWFAEKFPDWEIRDTEPQNLSSVADYNVWMTSSGPYRLFCDAAAIVVCQTDAVLIRSVSELDVGSVDFLGAPWSPPVRVLRLGHRMAVYSQTGGGPLPARLFGRPLLVGNGGLSFRRTAAFVDVATDLSERYPPHVRSRVHEDVYFAALGPQVGLNVANAAMAGKVFCESGAQHLDSPGNLWGFHGLQRWNPSLARRVIETAGTDAPS